MNRLECPMCNGEGYIDDLKPGGYFSSSEDQWYPFEESKPCPACRGTGTINKPQHQNVFNQSVDYQLLKTDRETKRHSVNDVVIKILKAA